MQTQQGQIKFQWYLDYHRSILPIKRSLSDSEDLYLLQRVTSPMQHNLDRRHTHYAIWPSHRRYIPTRSKAALHTHGTNQIGCPPAKDYLVRIIQTNYWVFYFNSYINDFTWIKVSQISGFEAENLLPSLSQIRLGLACNFLKITSRVCSKLTISLICSSE